MLETPFVPDYNHTDLDGDSLRVQLGSESAVFTASGAHGGIILVALRPAAVHRLIDSLQAMLPELEA